MAVTIEASPEAESWVRQVVRDEMDKLRPGERRSGLPASELKTVIGRIRKRRKRIGLPPDVVEEIIQEHRLECGRGPLRDEE